MAHDPLGPSSFESKTLCLGKRWAEEGLPELKYKDTDRGTAAHKVLEMRLKGFTMEQLFPSGRYIVPMKNGTIFELNESDIAAVDIALDYIERRKPYSVLFTERKVDPGVWIGRTDMKGTADITIIYDEETIEVADYKHGVGVFVDVVNCLQLILYGLGVVAERKVPPKKIILTVIQPRYEQAEPIRSWELSYKELLSFLPSIQALAMATDNRDAPRTPGKKQCQFCRAKYACEELAKESIKNALGIVADISLDEASEQLVTLLDKDPKNLTLEQGAAIYNHIDTIKSFLSKLEIYLTMQHKLGNRVPNYKLATGKMYSEYNSEPEVILGMLRLFNKKNGEPLTDDDLYKPREIKPVKQMRDSLSAKVGPEAVKVLEKFITKKPSKPILVPQSDSRKELLADVLEAFKPIGD